MQSTIVWSVALRSTHRFLVHMMMETSIVPKGLLGQTGSRRPPTASWKEYPYYSLSHRNEALQLRPLRPGCCERERQVLQSGREVPRVSCSPLHVLCVMVDLLWCSGINRENPLQIRTYATTLCCRR